MPYADREERNAHYRKTYAERYKDPEFRKAEAARKSKWYFADPKRRENVRLQVAAWRAKNRAALTTAAKKKAK